MGVLHTSVLNICEFFSAKQNISIKAVYLPLSPHKKKVSSPEMPFNERPKCKSLLALVVLHGKTWISTWQIRHAILLYSHSPVSLQRGASSPVLPEEFTSGWNKPYTQDVCGHIVTNITKKVKSTNAATQWLISPHLVRSHFSLHGTRKNMGAVILHPPHGHFLIDLWIF